MKLVKFNNSIVTSSNNLIVSNPPSSICLLDDKSEILTIGDHVYNIDISAFPYTLIMCDMYYNSGFGAGDTNFIFNNSQWNCFLNTASHWRLRGHYNVIYYKALVRTINNSESLSTFTSTNDDVKQDNRDDTIMYYNNNILGTSYYKMALLLDRTNQVCKCYLNKSYQGYGNLIDGGIFNGIKNVSETGRDSYVLHYKNLCVYGTFDENTAISIINS